MVFKIKTKEENIRGYVVPVDWDNDDKVIEVSIQTDNDDFEVDRNGLGRELLDFLDKEVEVTGIVHEDRYGMKRVTVSDYEVLSEADDEDECEDGDHWDIDFENIEDQPLF